MLVKRLEILKKKHSTKDGRKLFDINLMEMRFISFFFFYWQRVPTLVRLETSFFSIRPNEQWVDFFFGIGTTQMEKRNQNVSWH